MTDHDRKIAAKTLRDFVADQDDMREAFDSIQGSGITPVELVTYRAIRQAERIEAGEDYDPAARDRKIEAEAWDEGYIAGFTDGDAGGRWSDDDNPYRADRTTGGAS